MSAVSQSAASSSVARVTKKARRKQNRVASTASGPALVTNTVSCRPQPPQPLTVETRRSSLRSSRSAEVQPAQLTISADVKPLMVSPAELDCCAAAAPSPSMPQLSPVMPRLSPPAPVSMVPVLAQHIRQCVKFWSSKSTAVDAAAAMMKLQPCCADVVDAVLQVSQPNFFCVYLF